MLLSLEHTKPSITRRPAPTLVQTMPRQALPAWATLRWLSLRGGRSQSATLKALSWLLQLCTLSPTLLTFTARESSAIRVTACLPSAWSPLGSSRMSSSRLWTVRFCSPHSAPHCLGGIGEYLRLSVRRRTEMCVPETCPPP